MLGIELSEENGLVSLGYAVSAGVGVVTVKASEGRASHDDFLPHNVGQAYDVGLPLGAYCVGRPSAGTGAQDAQQYLASIAGFDTIAFHVLHLDERRLGTAMSLAAYAVEWLEEVTAKARGRKFLYMAHGYAQAHDLLVDPELRGFGLWVASWSLTKPNSFGVWPEVAAWQYTDAGNVPGVGVCTQTVWYSGPSY
jgi:GH25 family lysozyme M1 (1,4-beta-N-acetylmuramidase)